MNQVRIESITQADASAADVARILDELTWNARLVRLDLEPLWEAQATALLVDLGDLLHNLRRFPASVGDLRSSGETGHGLRR